MLPEEKRRTEGRFGSTSAREIDQRNQKPPIPEKLKDYLTDEQIGTIRRLEQFGWRLFFVRRPLFQESVTIMWHHETGETTLIEPDGLFTQDHTVCIRPG